MVERRPEETWAVRRHSCSSCPALVCWVTHWCFLLVSRPIEVETPKKEAGGIRGRVKLKADKSILADLPLLDTPNSTQISAQNRTGPRARTPDKGPSKPGSSSTSTAGWSRDTSVPGRRISFALLDFPRLALELHSSRAVCEKDVINKVFFYVI